MSGWTIGNSVSITGTAYTTTTMGYFQIQATWEANNYVFGYVTMGSKNFNFRAVSANTSPGGSSTQLVNAVFVLPGAKLSITKGGANSGSSWGKFWPLVRVTS